MDYNDFRMYCALIAELNDCVQEALFLMKNASYDEDFRIVSDRFIESLIGNANLLKRQIEEQVKLQFKTKR